jgi:GTPase SAR1 family protein
MKQDPSIGMDLFSKTIVVNGKSIKINIWDTAG